MANLQRLLWRVPQPQGWLAQPAVPPDCHRIPDSFRTLHFRHAREILQSPRLRVQTEEKVCEAAIGWLETHHYDRMQAELELRADLEHKLHSVTIPVLDLDRTSDVIKADCAAMQRQVDDQAAVVANYLDGTDH